MKTPVSDLAPAQWHVLGAGAMGCLWAVRLWQHPPLERRVTLLLRAGEELDAYRRRAGVTLEDGGNIPAAAGLSVNTPAERDLAGESAPCHPITAQSITDAGPALTHLLVATKAQDVAAALHSVRARLSRDTRIVLVQNGIRVQRDIGAHYGAQRVFCLSTSHGAWRRAPFHAVHAGRGSAWLGQLGNADEEALDALLPLLPASVMAIRTDRQIACRLWQKFAVNCAVNALTVVHDCRNGELLQIPAAREELEALVTEIQTLLAALPEVPALPDLRTSVEDVLRVTAENISSTLQDARLGRATELLHLNGYLQALARDQGLASPLNDALLQRVASGRGAPAA